DGEPIGQYTDDSNYCTADKAHQHTVVQRTVYPLIGNTTILILNLFLSNPLKESKQAPVTQSSDQSSTQPLAQLAGQPEEKHADSKKCRDTQMSRREQTSYQASPGPVQALSWANVFHLEVKGQTHQPIDESVAQPDAQPGVRSEDLPNGQI